MIIRTTGIPLAIYPYSSTSHIVHWLTRYHGKISTVLKGALRLNSRFLGEYELFSTSELLYFYKPNSTLYTAKECSLLDKRATFRTDWRAMQTASYLSALFNKTTPEEAPHPEFFQLLEELLDLAEAHGKHPNFMLWAELKFCDAHGHAPNLGNCMLCSATNDLRFCASQGGVVCTPCSRHRKLPTLSSSPDTLALLRTWLRASHPQVAVASSLTAKQRTEINAIISTFMLYHFNLNPIQRSSALVA
ncbi:MAG: DNA repair protein RecO [Pontiella sp.]